MSFGGAVLIFPIPLNKQEARNAIMLLTFTTLILFLIVGVLALAIGIFAKAQLPYYLGVIIIAFMGLMVLQFGISEQSGQSLQEITAGNSTSTTTTYTYTSTSATWTTGLGLLFVVIGAGLALNFYKERKDENQKKADSLEVED